MSLLYRDSGTGRISLYMDGVLRPVPDMDAFFRLYTGDPEQLGLNHYSSHAPFSVGPSLPGDTALVKEPEGDAIYLLDRDGDGARSLRRIVDWATFAAYGFDRRLVRPRSSGDPAVGEPVGFFQILYGPFDTHGLTDEVQADLKTSGFTTICVGLAHFVRDTSNRVRIEFGAVRFGDGGDAGLEDWQVALANVKSGTVKRVLLTLGGEGVDYQAIRDYANAAGETAFAPGSSIHGAFERLRTSVPAIDGVVLDNEEWTTTGVLEPMVAFGGMLASLGFGVVLCPYDNIATWRAVRHRLVSTGFEWHVQCYSGGAGNRPADWATEGVIVIPGFSAHSGDSGSVTGLSEMEQRIRSWENARGRWFLWQYADILRDNQLNPNFTPRTP